MRPGGRKSCKMSVRTLLVGNQDVPPLILSLNLSQAAQLNDKKEINWLHVQMEESTLLREETVRHLSDELRGLDMQLKHATKGLATAGMYP